MGDLETPTSSICCFNCGEPIMECEPDGWWAAEVDEMKQELEDMEIKMEVAYDAVEDSNERNHEMKQEVRSAKAEAVKEANERNTTVAMKLCTMASIISLMDDMTSQRGKPSREQLDKLNNLRREGGLPTI